jgi:hypothetical protein
MCNRCVAEGSARRRLLVLVRVSEFAVMSVATMSDNEARSIQNDMRSTDAKQVGAQCCSLCRCVRGSTATLVAPEQNVLPFVAGS